MGFISSIVERTMEGVVIPAIVVPDIIGEVVLCRLLKGDPSPCSSRSLEMAVRMIATPAHAPTFVTAAPTSPSPRGKAIKETPTTTTHRLSF
jgi:hypothetical protein